MSHYIADAGVRWAPYQRALCGVLIRSDAHALEPTCPRCQQRLAAIEKEDAAYFATLGYVELAPGVMGRPSQKRGPTR